jgi:hypothetical protein
MVVALMTSCACALIFGLAPTLQSLRVELKSAMSGTGASPRRNRLRGALIALQVAASCVLIMLAFTAVRGVRSYATVDPGIELDGLVSMEIDRSVFGHDSVRAHLYTQTVRDLVHTIPGVRSAASTAIVPLGQSTSTAYVDLPGRKQEEIEINTVGNAFFQTVNINPVRGRVFNASDSRTSEPVAVVNRAFLDRYGAGVLDATLKVSERAGVRIVGVVPEIAYHELGRPPAPLIYVMDEQIPSGASHERFLMRVMPGGEAAVVTALHEQMRVRFPDLVVPVVETLRQSTARQAQPYRVGGNVALAIGGIELALAAVGLYGLLMVAILARTREIGVRLALGATARAASWAVMRDGLRYTAYGAGFGMIAAIPASVAAASVFPGARAGDAVAFVAAFGSVLGIAAIAAYMPVRRAGRVDPATALRADQ